MRLLQTERARFLHSSDQLLVQHGEGGVRWEVQAVKASVSPVETHTAKTLAGGYQEDSSVRGQCCLPNEYVHENGMFCNLS